jgi:hypothetical protein
LARNDREIAVLTRSMLEILAELANDIEVPANDVKEQWVLPTLLEEAEAEPYATPLLRVHSGSARPPMPLWRCPITEKQFALGCGWSL